MAINANWSRWILASIYTHFNNSNLGLPLRFAGLPLTYNTDESANHFELRVQGPHFTELSKDYWEIRVLVNVYLELKTSTDLYLLQKYFGTLQSAFKVIQIKKYGNLSLIDDSTTITCINIVGGNQTIRTTDFGQFGPDKKLRGGTVEADFLGSISV